MEDRFAAVRGQVHPITVSFFYRFDPDGAGGGFERDLTAPMDCDSACAYSVDVDALYAEAAAWQRDHLPAEMRTRHTNARVEWAGYRLIEFRLGPFEKEEVGLD